MINFIKIVAKIINKIGVKIMIIKQDLEDFLYENLEAISENHLECWKDRYFGYTKKHLLSDLENEHDSSLEVEYVEEVLNRKLSDNEEKYLIKQFNKEVVKKYIKG